MCGIAGIFAYGAAAKPVDRGELLRMREQMAPRGPDGAGDWHDADGRIGLAHRRLSIIDLSDRAAQPMASADGAHIVVFNGEIYNFRALRQELEAKGRRFATESDTEVLLQLYAEQGAAMVERLRGMFAFALWDAQKQGLLLARDGFGIKPLWYADDAGQFRFASQVRALQAGGALSRDADPAGWVGFYLFGSVPEPFSTYRAIRSLPAGTTLWVDKNGAQPPRSYFSVAAVYAQAERAARPSSASDDEAVRVALLDSVRHHLVADVPVGIFLSAGIDSGALLGLMQEAGQRDTVAVTLTYDEYRGRHDDEAPLAARTAAHYGSRHHLRRVSEQEFRNDIPRIFEAMDQPTIDGINTWFISKAARELSLKAAVSGLGGDELFGGYPSFTDLPRWVRWMSLPSRVPGLASFFRILLAGSGLAARRGPKLASLLQYGGDFRGAYLLRRGIFLPADLTSLMDADFVREGLQRLRPLDLIGATLAPAPRTDFAKVATLETSLYMRNQLLRDADWASMAHSLEIRVPFVDAPLLQALAPLTTAPAAVNGKAWLANSPKRPLPADLLTRPKTGFTTPIKDWLQRDDRLQRYRSVPALAAPRCPWARRWAYQLGPPEAAPCR
jgi:asparagine synthase (glutamine-hydrolysing)